MPRSSCSASHSIMSDDGEPGYGRKCAPAGSTSAMRASKPPISRSCTRSSSSQPRSIGSCQMHIVASSGTTRRSSRSTALACTSLRRGNSDNKPSPAPARPAACSNSSTAAANGPAQLMMAWHGICSIVREEVPSGTPTAALTALTRPSSACTATSEAGHKVTVPAARASLNKCAPICWALIQPHRPQCINEVAFGVTNSGMPPIKARTASSPRKRRIVSVCASYGNPGS
mmetsp:Transcript_29083/g.68056  ORF Transcript_29083/g.68056 Transcript_29083/m.68056 type:complete len:230 (+) Transcript_29083:853-1542(+)